MPTATMTEAPRCDECDTEQHRVGTGDPQYWSCRYCGTATPIR